MKKTGDCEGGACFAVVDGGDGFVTITSTHANSLTNGEACDTYEAFANLRDAFKSGKYDHIGEFRESKPRGFVCELALEEAGR